MRPGLLLALAAALVVALAPSTAAGPHPERVVVGSGGWLFIAQDWTVPCEDAGSAGQAVRTATAVRDLAAALRQSGRRVVVVLGPDKSSVLRGRVPRAGVRAQECGDAARAAVRRELLSRAGPDLLDLEPAVLRATRGPLPTYWRKDTHWTPTGGAVYAEQLAARLDPAVRARLVREPATCRRDGDLARDLGQPDGERVRCAVVGNPGVTVVDQGYWLVGDGRAARWTTTVQQPGARVVPGRTVLVSDSFTSTALDSLAPLFEDAVSLYPGDRDDDLAPVLRQLRDADTVVLEVVERFAQRYRAFAPDAVAAVRRLPPRSSVVRAPRQPVGLPFPCTCPGLGPPAVDRDPPGGG